MKSFDLYCIKCNVTLPLGCNPKREYCNECFKIHRKEYNKIKHKQMYESKKLKDFMENQKITLIQSPYFVDQKTLNKIILMENK